MIISRRPFKTSLCEALQYFEQFVNQKLRTRQHIQVTFIPVRPDQLESYLNQGIGDLIAYPVAMTPEREQQVAFSVPLETGVKQILVTGKDFGPVASLQDLGGKKVFVNPLTTYYGNLEKVNDSLRKEGKPPIQIESADKNLLDEDLMEMVNAGILPQPLRSRSSQTVGQRFSQHHSSAQYRHCEPAGPSMGGPQEQSEVQRIGG
jgi:ABC-type amino acid transport substrate-binding protein